ncbi:MAG: right-handed parallel beta-helix repeat-containing protein, partial [Acidobacteria bacterium]|nr:right-handed parallel beta-helix repeat-containing protein [Acidobacteriota bacterium]
MIRLTVRLVTLMVCFAFGSLLSQAQNQRSFVSGVGSDANPCTRTAPCLTFQAALFTTVANGEINVLDPATYGTVFIERSITIDGTGTFAGISGPGNGIIIGINPVGPDVVHTVRLRGLSISGAGINNKTGLNGIIVVTSV